MIARRIEKYLRNHIDPKKLNKKLKYINNVLDFTEKGQNTRVGVVDPVLVWISKIIIEDFAIKIAIAGGVGSTIMK